MFEREYRELSFVPRWTIVRRIKEQSVAEHSYYVALYTSQVAELIEYKGDWGMLLQMALRHDLDEVFMSDIPGPAKRATQDKEKTHGFVCAELARRFHTAFREISSKEEKEIKAIVKVADMMDAVFYLCGEQQLGNRAVAHVLEENFDRLLYAWHDLCNDMEISPVIRNKGMMGLEWAFKCHNSEQSKIVVG